MLDKEPSRDDVVIALTLRQISLLSAALLALGFFIFVSGYFLGQKRAAQEFAYRADQESLADQIYSSMCVLYDAKDDDEAETSDDEQLPESEMAEGAVENTEPIVQPDGLPENGSVKDSSGKQYRAVLSGFPASLLPDAQKMVARLTKKGFPVELVEHTSRHKNIEKKWYQVITKPYASREELEKVKPQLAKCAYVKEKSITIVG